MQRQVPECEFTIHVIMTMPIYGHNFHKSHDILVSLVPFPTGAPLHPNLYLGDFEILGTEDIGDTIWPVKITWRAEILPLTKFTMWYNNITSNDKTYSLSLNTSKTSKNHLFKIRYYSATHWLLGDVLADNISVGW